MSWLPVAEAARVLGLTEQALRKRIARGTMEARKNNRGSLVVLVSMAGEVWAQPSIPAQDKPSTTASTTGQDGAQNTARPALADAPEMLPASVVREMLEANQRAASEAMEALKEQHRDLVDYIRSEHRDDKARQGRWYEERIGQLREEAGHRVDQARIEAHQKIEAVRATMRTERNWFAWFMALALVDVLLMAPWRH